MNSQEVCPPACVASSASLSASSLPLLDNEQGANASSLLGFGACNPQIPPQGIEEEGAKAKGKERQKESEKGDCETTFGPEVWPPENPDLEAKTAWKIVPLNFPRACDTPRDQSPTSAPEDPENVLPNQITAHSEGIFLRNVSPARALRLGNTSRRTRT